MKLIFSIVILLLIAREKFDCYRIGSVFGPWYWQSMSIPRKGPYFDMLANCIKPTGRCLIVADKRTENKVYGIYIYDLWNPDQPIWELLLLPSPETFALGDDSFSRGFHEGIIDIKYFSLNYIAFCASGGAVGLMAIKRRNLVRFHSIFEYHLNQTRVPMESISLAHDVAVYAPNKLEYLGDWVAWDWQNVTFPKPGALLWDFKRNCLWAGGEGMIGKLVYNWDEVDPILFLAEHMSIEGTVVDIAAVQSEDNKIWVLTDRYLFVYDLESQTRDTIFGHQRNIRMIDTLPGFDANVLENISRKQRYSNDLKKQFKNADGDEAKFHFETETIYLEFDPQNEWTNEVKLLSDDSVVFSLPKNSSRITWARWIYPNYFGNQMVYPVVLPVNYE